MSFSKGDIIMLSDILDENWYEGVLHGKTGVFPVNFVKVSREFIVFSLLRVLDSCYNWSY